MLSEMQGFSISFSIKPLILAFSSLLIFTSVTIHSCRSFCSPIYESKKALLDSFTRFRLLVNWLSHQDTPLLEDKTAGGECVVLSCSRSCISAKQSGFVIDIWIVPVSPWLCYLRIVCRIFLLEACKLLSPGFGSLFHPLIRFCKLRRLKKNIFQGFSCCLRSP